MKEKMIKCDYCNGAGEVGGQFAGGGIWVCEFCGGTGKVSDGKPKYTKTIKLEMENQNER